MWDRAESERRRINAGETVSPREALMVFDIMGQDPLSKDNINGDETINWVPGRAGTSGKTSFDNLS